MKTLYSTETHAYAGGGCVSNTLPTSVWLDENLGLPVGSLIVSVALMYTDFSEGGIGAQLSSTDAQGIITFETTISAPTISGAGDAVEFLWKQTMPGEAMVARSYMNDSASTNPCLIRVGYVPWDQAGDLIFLNNFSY